jgi:hypothetical protein
LNKYIVWKEIASEALVPGEERQYQNKVWSWSLFQVTNQQFTSNDWMNHIKSNLE